MPDSSPLFHVFRTVALFTHFKASHYVTTLKCVNLLTVISVVSNVVSSFVVGPGQVVVIVVVVVVVVSVVGELLCMQKQLVRKLKQP